MKPQTFAVATAAVVGGTGLMGVLGLRTPLYKDRDQMILQGGYGKIAGIVPTNRLFSWMRVGIGVAGLLAARDKKSAVVFNRVIAGSYAGMAVLGVIPQTHTLFGTLPIFGANVALHGATAAAELATEEKLLKKVAKLAPIARISQIGHKAA